MKKIMAILLCLALLLGCASGLAEDAEKQGFGTIRSNGTFTLEGLLPEGYGFLPVDDSDEAIHTELIPEDPALPNMVLTVAFDELYADVQRMNDLDDAAMAALEETFTITDPYAVISYEETAYGTRLLICRTLNDYSDYLDILSIYDGYMIEFVMVPGAEAKEKKLTEEQIAAGIKFLSDLDFVGGADDAAVMPGATYEALISSFNAEAKTVDVTLLAPWTFAEEEMKNLKEGDTIILGEGDETVETVKEEDGTLVVNDSYYFTPAEDGLYTATFFDFPLMSVVGEKTAEVPDTLVFLEGVDPDSGEILDEPAEKTAAEFFAALEKAAIDGVAFDSQNVKVTFDENGGLTQVERYYVPWQ